MSNDVRIVVDAQNRTATAFGAAAKGAKTVGDAAQIASRQLKDMDAKLDDANVKARRLAEAEERAAAKARDLAVKTALLRQEIASSGDRTGELGEKLARLTFETRAAANATDDYRRSANRAAADAREQARAYDRVADNARQAARAVALLGASAKLGSGGGKNGGYGGLLGGALNSFLGVGSSAAEGTASTPVLGPALIAAGAAAAVPAASFLGGAAGGAVLAGAGAAGAGLGLAGAWQSDPAKFEGMWTSSIDKVKKRWIDSSAAFGNELEGALKTADQTLERLPVEKVLALSQSFVAPLATGAGQGLAGAANGFADALERVQPVIDKIGPKLGNLGHDIGDAFRMISQGSEGGADALGDLIDVIGFTVKAAGVLILGFENAYESIRDFAAGVQTALITLPSVGPYFLALEGYLFHIGSTATVTGRQLGDAGNAAHDTAFDWGEMGQAAAAAAIDATELNDSLTKLENTLLGMANANLAVAQGWLDLKEGLEDGAKVLDTTSQAGIDNNKIIVDTIGLLERQREQAIDTGGRTQEAINAANAAYDAQIEKLRQAAYAAGFNHQKVDELIDSLNAVPPTTTASVEVKGLADSLHQGESLRQRLDQIDGRVVTANVYVAYHASGQSLNAPLRTGGIGHAAAGGGQSGLTEVGEEGRELVRLPQGSMVYPHANANQMAMQAGAGQRGGGIQLHITGNGPAYDWINEGLRTGEIQVRQSWITDN